MCNDGVSLSHMDAFHDKYKCMFTPQTEVYFSKYLETAQAVLYEYFGSYKTPNTIKLLLYWYCHCVRVFISSCYINILM